MHYQLHCSQQPPTNGIINRATLTRQTPINQTITSVNRVRVQMKLCVGQYGGREYHPGPRHWSFLLMLSEHPTSSAQTLQLCGNWRDGFFYKDPCTVTPWRSQSFLGKVEVGDVDVGKYLTFAEDVKGVPIINGNQGWNCQDWIVDVLTVLKKKGYNVSTPTKQELLTRLEAFLPPQKDPRRRATP